MEAFPFDTAPPYLLRDGDAIYGAAVQKRIGNLNMRELVITPASPWENAEAVRVIGSIRRGCFDHIVTLNERHLRCKLGDYLSYYHDCRTHRSLSKDPPTTRKVESPKMATSFTFPVARQAPSSLHAPCGLSAISFIGWTGDVECRERLGGLLQFYCRRFA